MFLNYFALGVLIFVFMVIFYGIIAIHDIPYLIAKKRNHPHADAIHTAGWVSLFTLHVIWPFLWIWATLYQPDALSVACCGRSAAHFSDRACMPADSPRQNQPAGATIPMPTLFIRRAG